MPLTVNFKNYDGTVLQTVEVESGATPAYTGSTPVKPEGDHVRYEFSGWSPAPAAITVDTDYTAQFTEIPFSYIKFVDDDGITVLSGPTKYDNGTAAASISVPSVPPRPIEGSDTVIEVFSCWSPALAAVSADAVYQAVYEMQEVVFYKVAFKDSTGYVLQESVLPAGATPEYIPPDGLVVSSVSPTIVPAAADAEYVITMTKKYEIMKEVRDMGNGYKRVILFIADGTIADDLPSWAATGSVAYGIDGTTAYIVDFDGTWSEAVNSDLVRFIINSL